VIVNSEQFLCITGRIIAHDELAIGDRNKAIFVRQQDVDCSSFD